VPETSSELASNVRLAPYTTLRVGGPARTFQEVTTDAEFISAVAGADDRGSPVLLIAGGSNLVIGDEGFPGLTVHVATRGVDLEPADAPDGVQVLARVAAGENWDHFVAQMVSDGYSGIETLSGIPGSVGATPVQNVGAYGNEVAEVIESVEVFDRHTRETKLLAAADCGFGYRSSIFKKDPTRWLILAVTFRLAQRADSVPIRYAELAKNLGIAPGDSTKPIQVRRAVLNVRRHKGMVLDIDDHDSWSAGSFFTNPIVAPDVAASLPDDAPRWPTDDGQVKLSAAWLIEQAGFSRGWSIRPDAPASLSHKHTLAITNRGQASADDVVAVARSVRDGVEARFGISLHPEPSLIGCSI